MNINEKCPQCNSEMKIHYKEFCPACYECKPQTLEYFDWFKVMYHLETKYPGIEDRLWNYMCDMGVCNDIYKNVYFGDGEDFERLAEAIGKSNEECAVFWISW